MAAVAGQQRRLWEIVQQRGCTGVVADLPGGHEEAQGAAVRIGDGVKLRVHAAFGVSDQPAKTPFLTRRLDAVRCAFRSVASIMTVFASPLAAASPSIIRRKTPRSPHRFHRLYRVLCGPYARGPSRHRSPLRLLTTT